VSEPRHPVNEPSEEETVVLDDAARRREEVVEEEVPPRRPPRLWPWLLALLLLVLGGLLAYYLLTRGDDKTTMPPVIGLTETEARARVSESELEAGVVRRPSQRDAGIVFAQSPGAGTQLDEGQQVTILVSSGLVEVPVPSVIDLREQEAVQKLEDAGFEVRVQRVFAGAPEGVVVEQDPRGGERAPTGSTVGLTVSKGRNLNPVPDVLGLEEDEAVSRLRAAEFVARIFDVPSTEPEGTVIAQQPQAGEQAPPDSRVRLNVSTGEQTGETTERPSTTTTGTTTTGTTTTGAARVAVPDVRDLDEQTATDTLEGSGFRVEVVREGDGDVVQDQQPQPGARAARGSVVRLFVG
jgi:beta-lactam-binding protein with PASTA domain